MLSKNFLLILKLPVDFLLCSCVSIKKPRSWRGFLMLKKLVNRRNGSHKALTPRGKARGLDDLWRIARSNSSGHCGSLHQPLEHCSCT